MASTDETAPARGILSLAMGGGVPRRSFYTALVVGSILTGINQGDVVLAGEGPNFFKIGLNYMVPYCVATYGAVTAKLAGRREAARRATSDAPSH